eukprot:5941584-Alexandrium_andersonii.AAC.2
MLVHNGEQHTGTSTCINRGVPIALLVAREPWVREIARVLAPTNAAAGVRAAFLEDLMFANSHPAVLTAVPRVDGPIPHGEVQLEMGRQAAEALRNFPATPTSVDSPVPCADRLRS